MVAQETVFLCVYVALGKIRVSQSILLFYTNKCIIVTIKRLLLTTLIVTTLLKKHLIYLCYCYKHLLVNSVTVLSYPAVKVNLTNC